MSGEIIYRHHEELGLKFYDPDSEAFPIPLKYVDVMRQIQTSINNVSQRIFNDIWTDTTIPDPTNKTC